MLEKTPIKAILFIIFSLALAPNAQAGLLGKTLSIGYYTNSTLTNLAIGATVTNITVGSGIELASWWIDTSGPWRIDISDTQIEIAHRPDLGSLSTPSPTRYIGFKDVNGTIEDFSSDPTLTFLLHTFSGFDASRLTITADSIAFRMNSLLVPTYLDGGYLTLQVGFDTTITPTPVPEPTTISLMLLAAAVSSRLFPKTRNLPKT